MTRDERVVAAELSALAQDERGRRLLHARTLDETRWRGAVERLLIDALATSRDERVPRTPELGARA